MADESIGQVSVNIVGDYSHLEKSFNEAQNIAQSAGVKISTGLEAGSRGADKLTSAMELTDDQVQNLFVDGMELANAWTKNAVGAEQAAAAMAFVTAESKKAGEATEDLGGKFQRVRNDAEAFEKAWGDALVENKRRTEELANATDKLESSVLSLVAAVVSFQALKQLGEDSLMAYGHIQQLTTSLDLMGAGAKGAADDVAKLRALAIQTAIPFDELSSQARKLSAVFGTGQNMFAVLKAAADDAAATGRSFDTVANGLERIEAVGTLTGRQLVTLGISWEQMAHSMGVSVEEAQNRMKSGAQSASQDVADTIKAIEDKFADASERQASNVIGIWTNVKNQTEFIFQTIGEQMAGLGPIISDGLKIAASGVIAFIGGIQQVTVAVVGMVREGMEGLKGLGNVAAAIASGNFVQAGIAASTAYAKIKTAAEYTDQSLQDHAKKTAEALIAIWADSSKKISATFTPTGGGGGEGDTKAIKDKVKGFSDQSGGLAVLIEMYKQEQAVLKDVTKETAKYNEENGTLIGQLDYLHMKVFKASESVAHFAEIELPKSKDGVSALEKETNKLFKTMEMLGEGVNDAGQAALDTTPWGKMDSALKTLGLSVDDTGRKTHAAKVAAAEFVAANSTDLNNVTASWQVLNSEVNRLAKVNLPAAIATQNELIDSMNRANAPLGQIYAAQEKELELEIQLRSERGQSADRYILQLELMRIKTDALKNSTQAFGIMTMQVRQDVNQLFDGFAAGIALSLRKGGDFWHFWHDVWQAFEQQVLTTVISAVIKFGISFVTAHALGATAAASHATAETAAIATTSAARAASTAATIAQIAAITAAQTAATATMTAEQIASFVTIKAAATLLDVSEVLGYAAVGGAAAAASTAAIPIIGPALALEVGAGMYAAIAGIYGPLATFSEGGMVPEDMLALVHKGEYVLPAEKTAQAVLSGNTNSSSMQFHFDFSGAHFSNGMNDRQVTTVFNRAFRMSKLSGALPPGRFPQ